MTRVGEALWLGLLAGVVSLDRVAFLQTMVSRPLVTCALSGWVVGDVSLGLRCGLLLELVWLMDLPVGAWVPPDDTLAALLAVAFAAAAPSPWSPSARAALGVLLAVPFGVLGRQLDVFVRCRNARLLVRAREGASEVSLGKLHLTGAVCFSVGAAAAASLGSLGGCALVRRLAPQLSDAVAVGLEWSAGMLALVGVAAVLAALRGGRNALWFGMGLVGGLGASGLGYLSGRGQVPWQR